ncbi:hypothetical protein DQ04_23931000 [Trypanosoma grayi]|uniref:hypothetical protein n=1 Tax=Trypanosoma grayi TaxID=71804 RepID=UPI0004F3F4AA|nr:hypothetical protein DQ04_23931000 [Trypanosoma grayi]KEG05294.1 hypothetical protein DQ04_23931000 [Trypanosoma grayi]
MAVEAEDVRDLVCSNADAVPRVNDALRLEVHHARNGPSNASPGACRPVARPGKHPFRRSSHVEHEIGLRHTN